VHLKYPFYVTRHGQTDWNLAGKFQGRVDIPLNDTGRQQGFEKGALIQQLGLRFFEIYSSSLSRAYDTAVQCAIGAQYPHNEIKLNKNLLEIDCGLLEGKTHGEVQRWQKEAGKMDCSFREYFEQFRTPKDDYEAQVQKALEETVTQAGVLLVTHAGWYETMTSIVLGEMLSINNEDIIYVDPVQKNVEVLAGHAKQKA